MLTKSQIKFLDRVCKGVWTENGGIVNVNGNVNMEDMNLTEIPVQFGQIRGNFNCSDNMLTTLPLENTIISDSIFCSFNKLTNLIGAPKVCHGDLWCDYNHLTSLEGCPSVIKGRLWCKHNSDLKYIWGVGAAYTNVISDFNELNVWIIACMQKGIIFPFTNIDENVKWLETNYDITDLRLLNPPQEIKRRFTEKTLYIINHKIL